MAEMITERSDPETKTLFMLLANIAQSELANQNRRIWRGVLTVNNMAAVIWLRPSREKSCGFAKFYAFFASIL